MADRTVKVNLTANTAAYTGPMKDASAATLKLALANAQQAAVAKEAAASTVSAAQKVAIAEKQAALAAAEASAKTVVGEQAQVAAKKEVEAASKALADQEKLSAKAVASAQREVTAASREAAVAQKAVNDQAKATGEAYSNTGKRMVTAGLVMVGAFALAEKATTDFDTSLSGVKAVANAAAAQMDQLRGAALQAGKDTAFTATQAADAEGELVKAGVSVQDVLNGGLKGALSLAAAGQLDLADSATIAANAMNEFNLKGSDVGHIADVLAAGANKSAADVGQLATGMEQSGLVAAQLGLSLEDTTAVLSAFADRGLKGADAGTSLKTMLERLAAPTGAAADQMKALGINAYDSTGKFVGVTSVAGQLHDKLGSLSEAQRNSALQTIFGSDAIRAATVLYNLGGQGMQGYIQSVNDSGAASRMAGTQMDNLGGDLKQLKGSLDVALIQSGSGANSVLRDIAQSATGVVNAFASLPKPLQETATAFAGGGGASLLFVGGIATAAGKVGKLREGLKEAEATAEGLKGGLAKVGSFMTGPWGLAIAGTAAAVTVFVSKMHAAKVEVGDFTQAIKDDGDALGSHTQAAVAADLANRGVYDSFTKLGVSMGTVTSAAMGNADAMKAVEQATVAAMKSGGVGDQAAIGKNLNTILATANALHDQQHAQLQANAATQDGAAASAEDQTAMLQQEQASKDAAVAKMRQAAASRAAFDAANAETSGAKAVTTATKGSTAAHGASTAATKANEKASKANETAAKAAAKAASEAAKAKTADAKASTAAANAADKGSYANSSAAGAAKFAAEATKDKTSAQKADTTASRAAETAAKDAAKAHDANARAAKGSAGAASADAQAQADAAEAAREAALDHQIGAEALKGWADAAKNTSTDTDILSGAVDDEVSAMKDAKDAANKLRDALDALNGVHISAGRAAIDVQDKIAGLTKALHDNGKTLDITTDKGRANMSAIYDLAEAMNQHAQSVADETKSVDAGAAALDTSRIAFDKVLKSAGFTTAQIDTFNQTLLQTPETVPVKITVDDADAKKRLADLKAYEDRIGYVHIVGTTGHVGMATGGKVVGPGTTTSDSIPRMLSKDEYVLNAKAASQIGYSRLDHINFAGGGIPALVRPQLIGSVGGTTVHPAAAAVTTSAPQMVIAPGADSAVATMIMKLVNTGLIQFKK